MANWENVDFEDFGRHECGWRTISQVKADLVPITEDMIGEEVAVDVPYKEDWVYGKVIEIGEYQGARHVRWLTLKTLVIEDDAGKIHTFHQEVIQQLLFKED